MSWIEIESERRLEFNRIEIEWIHGMPITNLSVQAGPTPKGKIRINVPTVLMQHLRDLGFPFIELPGSSQ